MWTQCVIYPKSLKTCIIMRCFQLALTKWVTIYLVGLISLANEAFYLLGQVQKMIWLNCLLKFRRLEFHDQTSGIILYGLVTENGQFD